MTIDHPQIQPLRTPVVRAEKLNIRAVWPNEAADFTPWLAEHLDWLAEDLELGPLTLEATEVAIPGGRSLDLLATDGEGRAVVIENQYGAADHDHLTRALAYAVAIQAGDRPVAALVVVAEKHRDEFVAVAEYLNECAAARADQGIRVFLAEVGLEQVGDSAPAVRFSAAAQPNDWEQAVRANRVSAVSSVDALLERLDHTVVETARRIVDEWDERDEAWIAFGTNSLVFYARNHRVPQGRCHVASIYADQGGTLWLNPGRLADSQAFDDGGPRGFPASNHRRATTNDDTGREGLLPRLSSDGCGRRCRSRSVRLDSRQAARVLVTYDPTSFARA